MKNQLRIFTLLALFASLSACTDDPATPKQEIPSEDLFKTGIYVVNEGNFGANNATIDLFVKDSNKVFSNIFNTVNNRPLGDVAQSMTMINGKGYIVLNGSGKVEVINLNTAVSVGTISGLSSPRYMVALDTNKAYLSDWVSNSVKVVNLQNNTIQTSIGVGAGPEQMLITGNRLFVCNSGGFVDDSTLTVINTTTNTVEQTIRLTQGPTAIVLDKNGKIWVLCRGSYGTDFFSTEDDTQAELICINPNNLSIEKRIVLGEKGDHPDKMKINKAKDAMFYLGTYNFNYGIYRFRITDTQAEAQPIRAGYYYGLGYDRVDDKLYVADALDFVQRGDIYQINESGSIVDSFKAGIIPNGIAEQ